MEATGGTEGNAGLESRVVKLSRHNIFLFLFFRTFYTDKIFGKCLSEYKTAEKLRSTLANQICAIHPWLLAFGTIPVIKGPVEEILEHQSLLLPLPSSKETQSFAHTHLAVPFS